MPAVVEAEAARLREVHAVVEESRLYPERAPSKFARKYLTVVVDLPDEPLTVAREAEENRRLVSQRQNVRQAT